MAKLRRIFASCCAESNLSTRVKELECKVRRLEKTYCKKVKKQLDELYGRRQDSKGRSSGRSSESMKKCTPVFQPKTESSHESLPRHTSSGSEQKKGSIKSTDQRKTSVKSTEHRRPSAPDHRKGSFKSTGQRKPPVKSSDSEQRRVSTSVNRVVFKKESTKNPDEDCFSDDTLECDRKENYFFITTSPDYLDKDQIPVKDIACSSPGHKDVKKSSRILKNSTDKEEPEKSSRFRKNSFGSKGHEDVKKCNRILKNTVGKEEPEKSSRIKKTSFGHEDVKKSEIKKCRIMKNSTDNEESDKSSRIKKNSFDNEEAEKPSGSFSKSFIEYTSILKQTKDINPVAANIATFNNASKFNQQPNGVSEAQQIEESFCNQEEKNKVKEGGENDSNKKVKKYSKAVNAVIPVKRVNRSVSTCKLPIDINLYLSPKVSKFRAIERKRKRNILGVGSCYRSNSQLGITRAVCFDNPSSCSSSQVSVKFTNVNYKRSCST